MTPSLHVQAALARWLAELAHDGVFATDTDLRVTMWNRWMEIQTRRPSAEVIGQPLFALYPDLVSRGLDGYYADALSDGRVSTLSHALHGYVLRLPPTHPDLGLLEMPQSGRVAPLKDGETIVGTVTVVENVSERLASESELRRQIEAQESARQTAERALRAKDEFLSTLSHELRTPLNAVLGWTRIILARKETHPANVRALQIIERNAASQAAMIDDILDVARIVTGKLRLEMAPTDLEAVVLAAIDVITPAATAKRLDVRTEIDQSVPRVLGDSGRLQQVVWNLLSNAVKFSGAGGQIVVRLGCVSDAVRLQIGDCGRGIAPEFLPFIFDRFRQSDASSARRQGGLGLGLALVKDLVQLHGGTIRAESAGEQQGALFTIDLPALAAERGTAERDEQHSRTPMDAEPLSGVRVLIVEDELDSRERMTVLLTRLGADVVPAGSADDAVRLLARADSVFDVLVSDIGMPLHDGYELMRRVRALPSAASAKIAAVAVTGYATRGDRQRALVAGYHAHIAKPVAADALAAEILRAIHASVAD